MIESLMGTFLGRFVLPLLLLAASLQKWSLISLFNLLTFLAIQFTPEKPGLQRWRLFLLLWCTIAYSLLSILAVIVFQIFWSLAGEGWGLADAWWAKVVGLASSQQTWGSTGNLYFVIMQLAVGLVALAEVCGNNFFRDSCWSNFSSTFGQLGSHMKVACCLLLPGMQLVASISHPSWISLPFFICSCVGLVDWSLTNNFLGLFRWWRPLLVYACFNILVLYIYQLPVKYPSAVVVIADLIGLCKVSMVSEWPVLSSGVSLLIFFFALSSVKGDLEEMDYFMAMRGLSLTEELLPSRHSFFIRESRSGVRHTNVLLRWSVFRTFSINFFTYGFPVLLLALSFWSFGFASICAFGLLAYVGYIVYAFPSLFQLHRLNGLLLIFILLWAASTYVFNVAFTFLNKKLRKDMDIWETIGLWHYPIPGFFLLAQFCLGVFVAVGNLVNNSVFLYLSDNQIGGSTNDHESYEVKEDAKVLVVATIAWGLRKSSRAITLALIFLLALKPGFFHAVYMFFFLIFLLSHSISKKMLQALIFFCETHFALLYIFQLELISKALENSGSLTMDIVSQLGLTNHATFRDFMDICLLLGFCAVQNHGFKVLVSFSTIFQQTHYPPFGFSVLKAGLNKSVLFSVYASKNQSMNSSHEKLIATYLTNIGQKFLSAYRSCGTYVAFLTILITVYLVIPNYVSFGYLFFLLFWIIGRQLVEKTRRRLWLPLKIYAVLVFIFTYILSISSSFQKWLSRMIDLYPSFGFNPEASLLENVWESVAVLIVMQLYCYERRESRFNRVSDNTSDASEHGALGFIRRFFIWHSDKILSAAVFYASLSSISAFGFAYLLVLIVCSLLPKASTVPSKTFLAYTGLLVTFKYLFQMWGKIAYMLPGQKYYKLSLFIGFKTFDAGFWGLESGLRGEILVIVACTLQYNAFRWLEMMSPSLKNNGIWEDPCQLFVSSDPCTGGNNLQANSNMLSARQRGSTSNSWPTFSSETYRTSDSEPPIAKESERSRKYSFGYLWGSSKESHKWNKSVIHALKKERLEMQKTTLKIYLKFWIENLFKLQGLEINMIALLVVSFVVLNVISMFYIVCLVACILLDRRVIKKLWPLFMFFFATILVLEYFAIWEHLISWFGASGEMEIRCHDCWSSSSLYFTYCMKCWLGVTVDDPRMLISYYLVFILSSFKFRSDHVNGFSDSQTYRQMISQRKNALVWKDMSFETKSMWTFLDYLKLYAYCHLLDIVLALILITGTLEYDVLHLGYLGFALVFFRMRLQILKKKNKIFKFLRIYNFAVIFLSLTYQCPYLGDFISDKCAADDYIYEIIGFYKYDYGFRITSRSALVEIVIFLLVSVQSHMFDSGQFDYVARYLEAEQIGAMVREQEKRASWKTGHLQHVLKSEEQKRQRNMQVEKMKAEMLNLQSQLKKMNSLANFSSTPPQRENLRRRKNSSYGQDKANEASCGDVLPSRNDETFGVNADVSQHFDFASSGVQKKESPSLVESESFDSPEGNNSSAIEYVRLSLDSSCEISELGEKDDSFMTADEDEKTKSKTKENPLISAVQLIGDGVSQVQALGNQAVTNIVSLLKIEHEESDSNEHHSADDGVYDEIEGQNMGYARLDRSSSVNSASGTVTSTVGLQMGRIFRFVWSQMRSNNDVVCYCCFILVFLWNFSLLSMVYLAALFLYALCVNSGPSYLFWVVMLIYTEFNIFIEYLYQIVIQHCGLSINYPILQRLGFPEEKITASFVVSTFPLFLVYITTLLQSSITAKDGKWAPVTEFKLFDRNDVSQEEHTLSYKKKIQDALFPVINIMKIIARSFSLYWDSLTQGSEAPPYFVQLSMKVDDWPEDGIQPERLESQINQLLTIAHEERCQAKILGSCHLASKVRIQSIERSQESASVALVVLEVVYASSLAGCPAMDWYCSLTPAADVTSEILKAQKIGLVEEVDFPYQILSVIGSGKRDIDLYAYIFGADLAVFFLVGMLYQSVIKNNSEFLDVYQLEDQFPKEFVFILMVLFFLIVLDRVMYLCSFATGKLGFYLFNLALFTYSVTEYAWYMQPSHKHVGDFALRAIYLTKTISFALQAKQIRYGIPNKSTLYQQFLTSKITRVNYLGFRLYRALPFLYELRCLLDWSCTSTSLTMYDWLKLEDINSSLFLVKCDAVLNRSKHRQGQRQTKMTKFFSGICLFFILICVIWAPMLMYSSGNPTNIANPIIDVSFNIDIKAAGGRLNLFQTTLCERHGWEDLGFRDSLDPQNYLVTYTMKDIQLICCQSDASTMWMVPPRVKSRFIGSLENTEIIFTWFFYRERPKGKEVVKYEIPVKVQQSPSPSEVKRVLNGTADSFEVRNIYPRYIRVTGSGEARQLEQTESSVSGELFLNYGNPPWWSFYDISASDVVGCTGLTGPMAIIVSEETPQGILGETLSKFSIWGLYVTFVLAVGRFIRLLCSDLRMRIPYENLPSCDRLIAICEDIYAARAEGELEVEEVLYWTLVKIYRSPHMLLEYTKPD